MIKDLADSVRQWATSDIGQEQLKQTSSQVSKLIEESEQYRKIDPKLLKDPVTI